MNLTPRSPRSARHPLSPHQRRSALGCGLLVLAVLGASQSAAAPKSRDTTAPSVTLTISEQLSPELQHRVGSTQFFNPRASGSFIVTVNATDAESSVSSVTFPALLGSGAWTDTTAPFARTYSWAAGASSPGTVSFSAKNAAGLVGSTAHTFTSDSTPPGAGAALTHPTGVRPAGGVSIGVSAGPGDTGAGLASSGVRRRSGLRSEGCVLAAPTFLASASASVSDTLVAGACQSYSLIERDHVGNARITEGPGLLEGNTRPEAIGSEVSVQAPNSASVSLSGRDADGDTLTYRITALPQHGSLTGSGSSYTYTPATGYSGSDSLTFAASDGTESSTSGTVSITVTAAPVSYGPRWHRTAAFQQEQPYSQHGGTITEEEAVAQARAFDLLTVQIKSASGGTATTPPTTIVPIYTRSHIAAMKAANPRLRIGVYINGGTASNPNHPEAWYAHRADGSRVVNTDFGTRYVMQPDNPEWRAYITQYAKNFHASSAYDDVFIDVLGDYPLSLDPVKPGTTTRYSSAEWYAMTSEVAAGIQAGLPAGSHAIANGLATGSKYPTSKALLRGAASAMAEIFTRTPTKSYTIDTGEELGNRTLTQWKAELTMIEDMNASGKVGTLMVKDWRFADELATREERIKYGFATAMLATNGTHYLGVSLGQPTTMNTYTWLNDTDYGTPQGSYTVNAAGVYQRVFSKGTIAVNPTDTVWSGTVRGRSVTIPAHRAALITS